MRFLERTYAKTLWHNTGAVRDEVSVGDVAPLSLYFHVCRRPGLERDAWAWVHFGANIGAAADASLRYSASDQDLKRLAQDALRESGAGSWEPARSMVGAESSLVYSRGARCVAVTGGTYPLFHREADRWPSSIDVDAIAGCASAFATVAVDLVMGGVTGP